MEKKMEEMEMRILQAIRAIPPPKTQPHGPEYQMQPPAQTQRRNPLPETTRTIPVPPQKTPTNPSPPNPKTALAVKQTCAAISAAGIDTDGFKLVPTRRKKTLTGPGIGQAQAPSVPSTPQAKKRRLIIRSMEKNRRIGTPGVSPTHIRDAVNRTSRVQFAFAEYNRAEELVLTTKKTYRPAPYSKTRRPSPKPSMTWTSIASAS